MNVRELILLDLKETRRRFLIVANEFPDEYLTWKPDIEALSVGATIRHVLLHDWSWLTILQEGRLPHNQEQKQLLELPYSTVQAEINLAEPYHQKFLSYIESLAPSDYDSRIVEWPHKPIKRKLGDTLERKSYHDAVHTGQLLHYMRNLQIPRPNIWD